MMIRNMDGTACIHAYAFTYNSIIGRLHVFSNLLSVYGHDKRMNDYPLSILFLLFFKLLKVLPDIESGAN